MRFTTRRLLLETTHGALFLKNRRESRFSNGSGARSSVSVSVLSKSQRSSVIVERFSALTSRGEDGLNGWLLLRVAPQVSFCTTVKLPSRRREALICDLISLFSCTFICRWRAQLMHDARGERHKQLEGVYEAET